MKKLLTLAFAFVFMTGVAFAQDNDASITQTGDDHDATIAQVGQMNEAFVDQTDGGGISTGNAVADIRQEGDQNLVNLRQVSLFGQLFSDSFAEITQIGNGNSVHGQTENDAFLQSNVGGIVDVRMEGNDNTLYSLAGEAQKNGNVFELDILGSENEVGLLQEFGEGYVDILGSSNDVTLDQKAAGASWNNTALYNVAEVDIVGDANMVDISQRSTANTAGVDVTGNSNTATITQSN